MAIIATINRIAIIATINRIAIIATINRIAIITTTNRTDSAAGSLARQSARLFILSALVRVGKGQMQNGGILQSSDSEGRRWGDLRSSGLEDRIILHHVRPSEPKIEDRLVMKKMNGRVSTNGVATNLRFVDRGTFSVCSR